MTRLADARVLSRCVTAYESPEIDIDRVGEIIAEKTGSRGPLYAFPGLSGDELEVLCSTATGHAAGKETAHWGELRAMWKTVVYGYRPRTRATSETSTTVSTVGMLLRACRKDEMLKRLSPARRATYHRIRRLREEIGTIPFSIARELRELRSHG